MFMTFTWLVFAAPAVLALAGLVVRDVRKQKQDTPSGRRRARRGALQTFLPIERFHPSGAMVVAGQFRQMVAVGDLNLYALSLAEIEGLRDRFQATLQRLNEPFQISVQARRANYNDYVSYAAQVLEPARQSHPDERFGHYVAALQAFIREEAARPRTDRANLIVVEALPKMTGEKESEQLARMQEELQVVKRGLTEMGLAHGTLDAVGQVESVQHFWSRERAVSQRYRDAFDRQAHAPLVEGEASVSEEGIRHGHGG